MTDKELKRLSRTELLELLVNQVEENEALKAQVSALTAKLEERAIQIEESGSLAEAALKLSGIFSAADEAAERYLENRKRQADELCAEKEKETQSSRAPGTSGAQKTCYVEEIRQVYKIKGKAGENHRRV